MRNANNITVRIRLSGMTVAGWARKNGFHMPSVNKVLTGELKGKGAIGAAIINALRRDNFWEEANLCSNETNEK